jgi:hypothetical protein
LTQALTISSITLPMVLAVAAVGLLTFGITAWILEVTGATDWIVRQADKLNTLFGGDSIFTEQSDGPGVTDGKTQIMADGSERNTKTGEFVALGAMNSEFAPKILQEARADGQITIAQVNAFITEKREAAKQKKVDDATLGAADKAAGGSGNGGAQAELKRQAAALAAGSDADRKAAEVEAAKDRKETTAALQVIAENTKGRNQLPMGNR